jgi:hypothetical protein
VSPPPSTDLAAIHVDTVVEILRRNAASRITAKTDVSQPAVDVDNDPDSERRAA